MIGFTKDTWPQDRWPNFNPFGYDRAMVCSHTGKFFIDPEFMDDVQSIRDELNRSMTVTSFYRDPTHPVEAKKAKPGAHPRGKAIDKAGSKFVHMDQVQPQEYSHIYRPAFWTY